ncbi:hypothetical protein JJQ73_00685 [Corynebacterium glutamicum]|uniref:hypothetical protein n=1 Tax=Corynebacterium glutamicum TaxID=1718 RepID=UPI001C6EBAFD|nr:hypothetical protein [Corynebacterium glutamicum]QYR17647.1 hypothetical protein JJQ73_00685 [Corynebacterium glutamicum]
MTFTVFEFFSRLADSRIAAETGLPVPVAEVIEDTKNAGEEVPAPHREHTYRGRFDIHILPKLTLEEIHGSGASDGMARHNSYRLHQ